MTIGIIGDSNNHNKKLMRRLDSLIEQCTNPTAYKEKRYDFSLSTSDDVSDDIGGNSNEADND